MAFNPDAYLSNRQTAQVSAFDPDTFLSIRQAQPVAEIEPEQPQTGGGRSGKANRIRAERDRIESLVGEFEAGNITSADLTDSEVDEVRKARIAKIPEISKTGFQGLSENTGFLDAVAALTTFNPDEFGRILTQSDPNIGIVTTPEGERLAINRKDNTVVSLNKLGFSLMDALQIGSIGAAFTPGSIAARVIGGGLVKQAGAQALAAGATEAALQTEQATVGGEFDLSDVALASSFGGGAEFLTPLFRATRDGLRSLRKEGEALTPAAKEEAIKQFKSIYSNSKTVQQTLKNAGVNPKQLESTAVKALSEAPSTANPDEVVASALFKELDIPTLKSRITQEGGQFQAEQELRARPDVFGAQVRERAAEESVGFQQALKNIVDDTGLPEEAGETIKAALSTRKGLLKIGEKKAYDRLKKLPGEGLPILTKSIEQNFTKSDRVRRLARTDPQGFKALEDILTEFGVLTDEASIAKFADPENIKPLTVDVAEDFRQGLNELIDPTNKSRTGAVKQIIGRLDGQIKLIDEALKTGDLGSAGTKSKAKIAAQKIARAVSRKQKKEFNPAGIVGKLTNPKKGQFDLPFLEADNVVKQLVSKSKTKSTFADLDRTMTSLEAAGRKGQQAIGNLQASTVLNLLEESTKGLSSKPKAGVVGFSGANYRKALSGIGEKELNRLFKDSPEILNTLRKLSVAAEFTQPISDVMNSSNSGVLLKNFVLDKLRMLPFASDAARGVAEVAERKQSQKAARRALQVSFDSTKKASLARFPRITDIIFDRRGAVRGTQPVAQIQRARTQEQEQEAQAIRQGL